MGRKKKTDIVETVEPMKEDAMNLPESERVSADNGLINAKQENMAFFEDREPANIVEKTPEVVEKVISTSASKVNVRNAPNGEVLFTVNNGSKVLVEEEKDGWCKVTGYIMSGLLK